MGEIFPVYSIIKPGVVMNFSEKRIMANYLWRVAVARYQMFVLFLKQDSEKSLAK